MIITRTTSPLPEGSNFARLLVSLVQAEGSPGAAAELAARHCKESPMVEMTLKALDHLQEKTAVAGLTTAQGLDAMSQYGIAQEGFLTFVGPSILGQLSPFFRRLPFRLQASKQLEGGSVSAWRGEGLPAIVTNEAFGKISLPYFEASTISVLTREIFRFGSLTERLIRQSLTASVGKFIDGQLLDPAVSETTEHPASLTFNAASISSSGSTAANIFADLTTMMSSIETSESLRWAMRPLTYYFIVAKLASVGYSTPPGYLFNIPVVLGVGSPQQVVLLDAAGVTYASDDTVAIDVSTTTSLQMSDAPTQNVSTGAGAQLVSLFQNGLVAVKVFLGISYRNIRESVGSPTNWSNIVVMPVSY